MKKYSFFTLIFILCACSTSQSPAPVRTGAYSSAELSSMNYPKASAPKKSFYKIDEPVQCVEHAREISGIPIFGDAYTWWGQADGKYQKGKIPKVGAVLVLSKTSKLKYGHLAVVKRVIDKRTIEVAHSNWGSDYATRCMIYNNMPVKDVSPANDWSQLRFWNYPSKSFGSIYASSGFIYAPAEVAAGNDE